MTTTAIIYVVRNDGNVVIVKGAIRPSSSIIYLLIYSQRIDFDTKRLLGPVIAGRQAPSSFLRDCDLGHETVVRLPVYCSVARKHKLNNIGHRIYVYASGVSLQGNVQTIKLLNHFELTICFLTSRYQKSSVVFLNAVLLTTYLITR